MKIIRGLASLHEAPKACVLTFGNFDSVHLGHQSIISRAVEIARQEKIASSVMIFEPQPEEFFRPDDCPARLTRLREKLQQFQMLQVDYVIVLHFNRALILYSAQQFLEEILIQKLKMRYLIVGEDCRFGANQQGNVDFLQRASQSYGFALELSETLFTQSEEGGHPYYGCRISSSLVRQVLAAGDLPLAAQLLGRSFCMSGRVVHGNKLARKLDFPTANIYLHRKKSPLLGVYQVKVRNLSHQVFHGIANIGYRPTVHQSNDAFQKLLLEVHLFDFDQDIYGKHLEVEFVTKIRDEHHFPSPEALKRQIELDVRQVRGLIEIEGMRNQPLD